MNTTESQSESHIEAETPADGGGSANGGSHAAGPAWSTRPTGSSLPDLRQLRRPVDDRMIAGVASGIARYLNVDVNLVRIAFVVLAFVGGAALPLYLVGWLLIPEDGAAQSIAGELFSSLENRPR
ncbi:MAG TPA: PspC domain-containing protein [Streptosporangiaceae bacterium]|nr:PspC domain-containing protein [Streptosporangiaceae bacterium]